MDSVNPEISKVSGAALRMKIERLRQKLNETAEREDRVKLLTLSRRLDQLIVEYQSNYLKSNYLKKERRNGSQL